MANAHKYVYLFSEGNGSMRELLGGKGANLAEMTNLGMPVPQGFTVTTEACTQYYNDGRQINEDIQAQIYEYLGKMEEICGKKFADPENPPLQHLLRQILRPSQRRLLRRRRPLHLHLLLNLHRSPHPQRPLMTSLLLRPSRLP